MKILARILSRNARISNANYLKTYLGPSLSHSINYHRPTNRTPQLSPSLSLSIRYAYSQFVQMPRIKLAKPKTPVHQFLNAHQIVYMEGTNVYKIKYCPFCPKPHNEDRTNLYVLNIQKEYGYYHCFRCSSKGNWIEFRQKILDGDDSFQASSYFNSPDLKNQPSTQLTESQYFFYKQNLWNNNYADVLQYIRSRGFSDETIKAFNLGAGTQEFYDEDGNNHKVKLVYFPMYQLLNSKNNEESILNEIKGSKTNFVSNNDWTKIVKIKMRGASKQTKRYMRQYPLGNQKGLFGFNLIKDTDKEVILTEGQFDAMAVYQQTGRPAVSLPQGATNLPDYLVRYFDKFDKIILWMDNDEAGLLNTTKIAQKLGLKRTAIVKHTVPKMKDANDFLNNNKILINQLLNKARTIPDSHLIKFENVRESIKSKLLNEELNKGLPVTWLPFFNNKVKGVRLGQLTIVSGPTGSGKTTFLSQLFLDLCKRDIGVLWGSFQIRNQVLITNMLNQFCNVNLSQHIQKYQFFANKFQKLPLHLMNFYGSTNIQKILSTIVYSIQKYNIHCVVLDTLQFMLSQQGQGFKKFQLQDTLMAKLRQISIKYNVHVAIVIHPRKTEESQDIGIHSIYGTSKATQEADNIWIIQNRDGFKLFDVKKNRYDGQLGRIPLGFNRTSKTFIQLTRKQFEALRNKEMTMKDIISQREENKVNDEKSEQEWQLFEDKIEDHELARSSQRNHYSYNN